MIILSVLMIQKVLKWPTSCTLCWRKATISTLQKIKIKGGSFLLNWSLSSIFELLKRNLSPSKAPSPMLHNEVSQFSKLSPCFTALGKCPVAFNYIWSLQPALKFYMTSLKAFIWKLLDGLRRVYFSRNVDGKNILFSGGVGGGVEG